MKTKLSLLLGFACLTTAAFAKEPAAIPEEKLKAILNEGLETAMVVVADTSGSMRDQPATGGGTAKIDLARTALEAFVNKLPADLKLGMIIFWGCQPRWVAPFGSSKASQLAAQVHEMQARGSTPIHLSLEMAYEGVKELRTKNPYARVVVLLLTDGEETCSPPEKVAETAEKMAKAGIELQVIGFDLPSQDTQLKKIGTRYYLASDSKELEAGLSSVQGELAVDAAVDAVDGGK